MTPEEIAASWISPEFYLREILGIERLAGDYVLDIFESVKENRETRVQAGRGVAKSHTLGCLASWWFDVFPSSSVFLTGTVYRQVRSAFRECQSARRNALYDLPGRILETEILDDDPDSPDPQWRIVPFAAKNADAALGGHADYVLVLVDEASGMDPEICKALRGCMSGPEDRIVWSGNPMHTSGHFADLATKPHVRNFTISVKETINYRENANLIRGVAGREFAESIEQAYGIDSDVYRVHVLGQMPKEGGNSIFSLAGIADARARGEDFLERVAPADPLVFGGLDLARLGSDRCALDTLVGGVLVEIEKWGGRTLDFTMDRARGWLVRYPTGRLLIDATSEGTFSDVLGREFPGRVVGVNFGGAPVLGRTLPTVSIDAPSRPLYENRRAEMWYEAAKWTASTGAWSDAIPDDVANELEADLLSAIRVDPSPAGAMRVERKEIARKRLGRSPDLGDAYCLAVSGLLTSEFVPRSSRTAPAEKLSGKELARRMGEGAVRYRHRYGRAVPVGALNGRERRR